MNSADLHIQMPQIEHRGTVSGAGPSRDDVWKMFNRISPRYDLLNRLLSFGRDVSWRKKMARYLPAGDQLHVLDVATGTADVILSLFRHNPRVFRAVGVDMAERMLEIGRQKIYEHYLEKVVELQRADATRLPFPDNLFDAVTIAFGIRNLSDVVKGLREMWRVVKPGGRVLILEFSLPARKWIRQLYLLYFRHVLPRVGGWLSGDSYAYRYLNETVENFPYGESFCQLLEEVHFQNIRMKPLTFGVATLYYGEKPMGRMG